MSSHIIILPLSKKSNDKVSSELSSQDLCEEVNIGDKCSLEDNWNVGGIEKSDWIWLSETSHLSATELELDSETLEVDDDKDDNNSGNEIQQIWSILSVECLLEAIQLVWLGKQEVE